MASIIVICLILIAVYAGTKRLSGFQVLGVACFTVIGIVLVVFPNASTRVANFLGIGRGTDLILYLAVLGGLFVASNFYFRFKRHEQALITLARQSAIGRAREPGPHVGESSLAGSDRSVEQVQNNLD